MTHKKFGHFPWGYGESFIFIAVVVLASFGLQVEYGSIELSHIAYPANLIYLTALVVFCLASAFIQNNPVIKWLSGLPFAIAILLALLILSMFSGLIPQNKSVQVNSFWATLGFRQMISSWPFVIVYGLLLLSLGLLIVKTWLAPKKYSYAFYLNHIGLFILLAAAALSHSDMRRFVMYPYLGEEPQWRVYNHNQEFIELPLAIRLNTFKMESYPAKIAIYSTTSDSAIPPEQPTFYQLHGKTDSVLIGQWQIEVEEYIHQAAKTTQGYQFWNMVGSAPAAKLTAHHLQTKEQKQGWISPGSLRGAAQPIQTLKLDDDLSLIMLPPEPKHFVSEITIYTAEGEKREVSLMVNHPITIGSWKLYQQGYDEEAGAMSSFSAIELVYDPWLNAVYLGLALLALGALGLVWSGRKQREEA